MGWTSFNMHRPVKDWFKESWESNGTHKVLDCALVHRNTMYGAIKDLTTNQVYCAIFLIRWSPKSWNNFSYKDMTEFSGCGEIDCPERIFKLLTPLTKENDENDWARNWRESVNDLHRKRKEIKKLGNFIFKLKQPIRFTNGGTYQYFKKVGRTIYAGRYDNNSFNEIFKVRIGNLANYNFEVIDLPAYMVTV